MSMSHYEGQVMLGCLDCDFADEEKLKKIKKFHDQEKWIECSSILGSCRFPFKRDLRRNEDGITTCHEQRSLHTIE